MTFKHITAMGLVTTLTVGSALPAQAQPRPESRQIRVSAAGLDLKTDAGADIMLRRLARAAEAACGGRPDPAPLGLGVKERFELCRSQAMSAAVADLSVPSVSRRFAKASEAIRTAAK